jgi:ABC-type transport system involved in cytochrome c biogenesis permease component
MLITQNPIIFFMRREWILIKRQIHVWIAQLGFVFLWLSLIPFFCQNNQSLILEFTPVLFWFQIGLIWMIGVDRILKTENFLPWLLSPYGLNRLFWGRVIGYWGVFILFLIIGLIYFKILYLFSISELGIYALTAILGTPGLVLLTLLAGVLMFATPDRPFLAGLFIVPWSIPVYLLGFLAIQFYQMGQSIVPILVLLGSFSVLCLASLPRVIIYILRSHLLAHD